MTILQIAPETVNAILAYGFGSLLLVAVIILGFVIKKTNRQNREWKTTELAPGKKAILMTMGERQIPVKIREKNPIGRWVVEIEVSESSLRFPEDWKPSKNNKEEFAEFMSNTH